MAVTASQEPLNKLALQLHYIQKMVSQQIVDNHVIVKVFQSSVSPTSKVKDYDYLYTQSLPQTEYQLVLEFHRQDHFWLTRLRHKSLWV